jgi:hypothetical protein
MTSKCDNICEQERISICLIVLNATFNNISVISWLSVLLVEETGGSGENHRSVVSHSQTLSYNVVRQVYPRTIVSVS